MTKHNIETMGCSNGFCWLKGHAKGMHTNTTCKCLRDIKNNKLRLAVQRRIAELEQENRALKSG